MRLAGLLAAGLVAGVAVASLAGCPPNLDETVSLVTIPRILGVQSVPAEAAPMASMTFTALVVDGNGPIPNEPSSWAFCNARNPLANLGPVNTECLQYGDPNLQSLGVGPEASGVIPATSCRNFGPEQPAPVDGGTAGRPVDPDGTGGYYQPVSIFAPSSAGPISGVYLARISCGVANATPAQSTSYESRYHLNDNPAVLALTANGAQWASDDTGKVNTLTGAGHVSLVVTWPTCPLVDVCGDHVCGPDETMASCPADCATPVGCAGAERYVNLDLGTDTIVDQREGINVSWFATSGTFDEDQTGNDATDTSTTSSDGWLPSGPGTAHLWVVLHDTRGGIGWKGFAVDVK